MSNRPSSTHVGRPHPKDGAGTARERKRGISRVSVCTRSCTSSHRGARSSISTVVMVVRSTGSRPMVQSNVSVPLMVPLFRLGVLAIGQLPLDVSECETVHLALGSVRHRCPATTSLTHQGHVFMENPGQFSGDLALVVLEVSLGRLRAPPPSHGEHEQPEHHLTPEADPPPTLPFVGRLLLGGDELLLGDEQIGEVLRMDPDLGRRSRCCSRAGPFRWPRPGRCRRGDPGPAGSRARRRRSPPATGCGTCRRQR